MNIPKQKVVSAIQAYNAPMLCPVVLGPQDVNYTAFPAQSASTASSTFVVNVPSKETGLCKTLWYNHQFQAIITGTNLQPSVGTTTGFNFGLSDSALDQFVAVEQVSLGPVTNSVYRSQYMVELNRIHTDSKSKTQFNSGSGGEQFKDRFVDFTQLYNTNADPLSNKVTDRINSDCAPLPRTADVQITANTGTSATVVGSIWTCSKVSPFDQTDREAPAIRGLSSLQITLTYETDIRRLFSYYIPTGSTATITNVALSFTTQPVCYAKFVTPSAMALMNPTPWADIHKYYQFQCWLNAPVPINAGAWPALSLQSIYASIIPDRLVLFARQQVNTINPALVPRSWLPLAPSNQGVANINLQFCNQVVLQNVPIRDL